jgi:hypothetical protein
MAAVAQEIEAGRHFGSEALMILLLGIAVDDVASQAAEAPVDDKIDHAGHGVGAPLRAGAAGHHIHAFDDAGGKSRKIDAADGWRPVGIGVRGHDTLAVEQNQGAHHAQIAQIDGVEAGVALGRIAGVRTVTG